MHVRAGEVVTIDLVSEPGHAARPVPASARQVRERAGEDDDGRMQKGVQSRSAQLRFTAPPAGVYPQGGQDRSPSRVLTGERG
jgi:hypothetical protein